VNKTKGAKEGRAGRKGALPLRLPDVGALFDSQIPSCCKCAFFPVPAELTLQTPPPAAATLGWPMPEEETPGQQRWRPDYI